VSDTTTDVVDARPATSSTVESPSDSHPSTTGSGDASTPDTKARRKPAGLNGMVLAELQQVASGLGISGTGKLRKGALIEAISAAQNGGSAPAPSSDARAERSERSERPPRTARSEHSRPADSAADSSESAAASTSEVTAGSNGSAQSGDRPPRNRDQRPPREQRDRSGGQNQGNQNSGGQNAGGQNSGGQNNRSEGGQNQGNQAGQNSGSQNQGNQTGQNRPYYDEDDGTGRRRRRGRNRDRRPGVRERGAERFGGEAEPVIGEDDVLVAVGGIVDVLDNYAFVRTTGYLPGPNDVYITLAQVRKYGLRKGDAVTGAVKQAKDGERRDKFNALVRLDTVNVSSRPRR